MHVFPAMWVRAGGEQAASQLTCLPSPAPLVVCGLFRKEKGIRCVLAVRETPDILEASKHISSSVHCENPSVSPA